MDNHIVVVNEPYLQRFDVANYVAVFLTSFTPAGPHVWNNLSHSLWAQDLSYDQFKSVLETFLFK